MTLIGPRLAVLSHTLLLRMWCSSALGTARAFIGCGTQFAKSIHERESMGVTLA